MGVPAARVHQMPFDAHTIDALRIDRKAPGHGRAIAIVLLILIVIGGAGAAGWWWWTTRGRTIEVRTVEVASSGGGASAADRTTLNASGYVTARRHATVSSKVTGKVTEVFVEEGMSVKEGQKLATIDSSNVETSLALAEANLGAAKQMLGETQANLHQ
ncbi:MAG: biotin/lipoyl-binding protein, partial [Phycisphaerae bacterium]|nr:biotin/lipoyl-binding protein [Phycisphaerae bacterium]